MEHPPPPAAPGDRWHRKRRYHHGNLGPSALARGRQIVTLHGPAALTLRGLARDLGVTATSLVRLYGNLAGMRAAVAESVLDKLRAEAGVAPRRPLRVNDVAGRWVDFAATHANLYRLLCGEGWHLPGPGRGFHGMLALPSPRRSLEDAILQRTRRPGNGAGDREQARYLGSVIHGLALARIDGVEGASVNAALARALRS